MLNACYWSPSGNCWHVFFFFFCKLEGSGVEVTFIRYSAVMIEVRLLNEMIGNKTERIS